MTFVHSQDMKFPPPVPTGAELDILRVLWATGPASVREVHDTLGNQTSYTSTLKLMQMMREKRLVDRDDSERQHIYRAAVDEERTVGIVLRRFVDRVFDGSAGAMALRALGDGDASREDLIKLKRLIQQLEKGREQP